MKYLSIGTRSLPAFFYLPNLLNNSVLLSGTRFFLTWQLLEIMDDHIHILKWDQSLTSHTHHHDKKCEGINSTCSRAELFFEFVSDF